MPPGPGSLAVMCSCMPSSGCSRITSRLGSLAPSLPGNIGCGTALNWITISEHAAVHPLAGAQVERHAGPAPVLHLGLDRHEGLGGRAGPLRARRGTTARRRRRPGRGCTAPRRRRGRRRSPVDRPQRLEHLELLVAHGLAVDVRRGLHGDQAEQLEQVVLHHVAQRAGAVVVAAAAADAEGLGGGDLDVVDRSWRSTAARGTCWRSGSPGGSARSPCRGSGRSGRSGARRRPRRRRR